MDRLICGDVGYGKRSGHPAAYCTVMSGKQVILVPTTVLQQHHQTFCERFKIYPV
jgi:transcription-repair coupling factor (superfamily II helicase)